MGPSTSTSRANSASVNGAAPQCRSNAVFHVETDDLLAAIPHADVRRVSVDG